ncbi:MAG: TetR/AcrR family transcriptional regulator [Acidimicrobiales bacterium]
MNRPLSRSAHDKILECARSLIGEVGADRFTVDEVVRRSGVAKTTIYRHFNNAGRLLIAALDEMIETPVEVDTGSLRGDLDALLIHYLPILNNDTKLRTILTVMRAAADDHALRAIHAEMLRSRLSPIFLMIERAQARGEVDPDLAPEVALSMLEGPLMMRRMMTGEKISEATARDTLERVIRALAPPTD